MTTLLLPTAGPTALSVAVERAREFLADGQAVGLPTETVYGLAADALNPGAVVRIFEAKERPYFDPLIVHLPAREWVEKVALPFDTTAPDGRLIDALLTRFWPGPLTLLMPRRTGVIPDIVTAGSALVAVRQSAHPVFRAVIDAFGRPLAAPSANRFGRISPTDGPHVVAELADRIPLVLDGGPTLHGLESTIVSVTPEGEITIWRHGPITAEALRKFAPVHTPAHTTSAGLSAPGQLPGHYAPGTPLILLDSQRPRSLDAQLKGKRVGLLRFSRHGAAAGEVAQAFDEEACLSEHGELREAAARLFAALRHLDGAGLDVILTELVPETGLGVAINERLRRAAAGSGLPERP